MVHYFLHKLSSQSKAQKFQKTTTLFIMFFSNLHSTTLESIKHKQYLISKQKHSKISLYLIMLPRQLLHTHSTNYTHTCTNWLKGCDNYKLKLIIFLHECRDCIAQSRNTTNFLLITSVTYRVNHQCCPGENRLETPGDTPHVVSGFFWLNHWQIQTKWKEKLKILSGFASDLAKISGDPPGDPLRGQHWWFTRYTVYA